MKINIPKIIRMLLAIFLLYLVYAGLLFFVQGSLLFPVSHLGQGSQPWDQMQGTHMQLGPREVDALYYPSSVGSAPAVIIAHGNGERIEYWDGRAAQMARTLGVHVLVIEYPGYQNDGGKPSQANIAEGFEAGHQWLSERSDVSEIHGLGLSIGTGVVCYLAERKELKSLTLIAPFSSIRSMAKRRFVPGFLVTSPFDNERALRSYAGKVLLVVAEDDAMFGPRHPEALSAAAPDAELIYVPGGHNDVLVPWPELLKVFIGHWGI